jgi:hypothetical protein
MKRFAPLLLLVAAASGCSLFNRPSSGTATVEELDSLPVGIDVTLTAYSVRATDNGPESKEGERYVWSYRPTVQAKAGKLTVVDYGVCSWQDGRWVLAEEDHYDDASQAAGEFEDDFPCPNGRLTPGQSYAGVQDYYSDALEPVRLKWFVVARDESGNLWKGEAELDLLAELEPGE